MGDLMRLIDFGHLIDWSLEEYTKHGTIFSIRKEEFYKSEHGKLYENAFGEKLATLIGPAAGPHSQLAQNIIVAYLCGARFMEIKTVQIIDGEDLRKAVPKPCILAEDEGYNTEWSTELEVPEAYDEYIKAWLAIKVLSVELGLSDGNDFAYNMSVGYDLAGIKSEKVDGYIEGLKDATRTEVWGQCMDWLKANLGKFKNFKQEHLDAINPSVCHSITLSTLHGCPADEIERIASYLITEKNLNTFVKCNPTLLGYEYARKTLDDMGFDYIAFDEHHFNEDLQFDAAVAMFKRLTPMAAERNLKFGVKLTNTFPVQIERKELPGEEMYMSGRALYTLTTSLGAKLSRAMEGTMPISYSGGADAFNIAELLECGIQPVTVCTTLLKPGGYGRFKQLAEIAEAHNSDYHGIDVERLENLVQNMLNDPRYHKRYREKVRTRKTETDLPVFDCFKAPCESGGCPIEQRIPEYLDLVSKGKYAEAIKVITVDNSAPTVTGVLCPQPCREHCTRLDYERPLEIRSVKLVAAEKAQDELSAATKPVALRTKKKAVVIGAGPAGLAAGLFLRRNGMDVDIFEKREKAYGVVRYIIPPFRISDEEMDRDVRMVEAAGVNIHYNADPNYDVDELKKNYDYVIIATGSWNPCSPPVKGDASHFTDAFAFLDKAKNGGGVTPGKRVAVIGAGDVAMDCVRTAKRAEGVEHCEIVYRRTETYMPAAQDEINHVLGEGIPITQLVGPISYDGKVLRGERMELGTWDELGLRKSVLNTGTEVELQFDTVVVATGARTDTSGFLANGINLGQRGKFPILTANNETNREGVFVLGDCRKGPSTIVQAIADAKVATKAILAREGLDHDFTGTTYNNSVPVHLYSRRGVMVKARKHEASEGERCLQCANLCEMCTEVCPNRANVHVRVEGFRDPHQIVHLDGMCNECGNCRTFCPHAGRPYTDKTTVFWSADDFKDSRNPGFVKLDEGKYLIRDENGKVLTDCGIDGFSKEMRSIVDALEKDYAFYLTATAAK